MKEEIKMKAHGFKNNETMRSATHFTISVIIIIAVALMIILNQNNTAFSDEKKQSRYATEAVEYSPAIIASEKVTEETSRVMSELTSFLIPEDENELQIVDIMAIAFPETDETVFQPENNVAEADSFLSDLKVLTASIIKETIDLIELEKRARVFLALETDLPLELEDWMTDEKCWCLEDRQNLATTENIKISENK